MALTIDEVLNDLPRAPGRAKTAHATLSGPVTYGSLTRKLAALVREVPEPVISWESLYAVKTAGYRSPAPSPGVHSTDDDDTRPGAPLRKMASVVRGYEDARAVAFFEKNAQALKAVRGLTLLRELVSR